LFLLPKAEVKLDSDAYLLYNNLISQFELFTKEKHSCIRIKKSCFPAYSPPVF